MILLSTPKTWMKCAVLLCAGLFLAGCFATATRHAPPPMEKRQGTAPTAALLPFENTNDPEIAGLVTEKIKNCLEERNVLTFAGQQKVNQVVDATGYDMGTMFGLKKDQYKNLGNKLGVDYTLHGTVSVRKSLTFSGWRKDVDVHLYINDAKTGQKIDSWRSMTDFTWTKGEDSVNAETMAESAANHICAKMLDRSY
ncbi:MAG: hypothetical protein R6U41_00240 [Desulfosalsimonas sp.]|uniref:hypothetical protein n=1 Tax=Desulfosalsimonas sp. TaxID=3073848 RepID=UPI00397068D6